MRMVTHAHPILFVFKSFLIFRGNGKHRITELKKGNSFVDRMKRFFWGKKTEMW